MMSEGQFLQSTFPFGPLNFHFPLSAIDGTDPVRNIFCHKRRRSITFTELGTHLLADNMTQSECSPSRLAGPGNGKIYINLKISGGKIFQSTAKWNSLK